MNINNSAKAGSYVFSKHGTLSISKSYYMGEDGPTKTAASERVIALGKPVIGALEAIKPLHVTETDLVVQKQRGAADKRR